jgi:hypothetical protein
VAPAAVPASDAAHTKAIAVAGVLALAAVPILYGLGALAKWGQARELGLSPDVLTLVPMGQLVTTGTQAFLVALLALPIVLCFAYLLHLVLPVGGREGRAPALGALDAAQARLRRDLDELRGAPVPVALDADELYVRRLRRLDARAHKLDAAMRRRLWLVRAGLAVGVIAGVLLITPARLLAAAAGVWLIRRLGVRSWRFAGAILVTVLLAVAAERLYAPDPLPDATIRPTNGGQLIKGPLLGANNDVWHVLIAEGRIKSVPTAQIAKSSLATPSDQPGFLGRRLLDVF